MAGQHEGVQAQAAADGARQVADQIAVGRRHHLHLLHACRCSDAQRRLELQGRSKRANSRRAPPFLPLGRNRCIAGRSGDGREEHELSANLVL